MRSASKEKLKARVRRHQRVRRKIVGNAVRPRLSVFRSLNNIYGQIIDDSSGKTLFSVSSLGQGLKGNIEGAKQIGASLAKRALDGDIKTVVFDRGGYLYHGRIKAFADAAREGGLKF